MFYNAVHAPKLSYILIQLAIRGYVTVDILVKTVVKYP